jgi:hypothetical protein
VRFQIFKSIKEYLNNHIFNQLSDSFRLKIRNNKVWQFTCRHISKILILFVVGIMFIPVVKKWKVQKRFGVMIDSPELAGHFVNRCEPIMLITVDSVGAFYQAGFREGDVLLDTAGHFSMEGFIKSFDQPPGTEIRIKSIPNGCAASNCEELHKMKQVTRKVIAP